jgi:hypothetical protein
MEIYTNGIFYNPAVKHYDSSTQNIVCDKCNRQNLKTCLGYENLDLCLRCASVLDDSQNLNSQKFTTTRMEISDFRPNIFMGATRMETSDFKPKYSNSYSINTNNNIETFDESLVYEKGYYHRNYDVNIVVWCDKCSKQDIKSSIKSGDYDICLNCAASFEDNLGTGKKNNIKDIEEIDQNISIGDNYITDSMDINVIIETIDSIIENYNGTNINWIISKLSMKQWTIYHNYVKQNWYTFPDKSIFNLKKMICMHPYVQDLPNNIIFDNKSNYTNIRLKNYGSGKYGVLISGEELAKIELRGFI